MQGKRSDPSRKQLLPAIAPKDDRTSSTNTDHSLTLATSNVAVPPRARLPPRSRTGCWTCRTRKVKCDEGRPACGQCNRLGHTCDYSPRLSFRDDTPRVVERMQDISTSGNTVWDRTATSPTPTDSSTSHSAAEDVLPPFTTLTSDEDRERKAEAQSPGTYHVIINPDSFSHLPEYNDDMMDRTGVAMTSLRRGSLSASIGASITSSAGKEWPAEAASPIVAEGPNTVILTRFEDSTRRATLKPGAATVPAEVVGSQYQSGAADSQMQDSAKAEELGNSMPSLPNVAAAGGQDSALLDHFRTRVWRQMMQIESSHSTSSADPLSYPGEDVFEQEAEYFGPLYHAMMALSALSLAHQDGERRLDALQHYQQALPALSQHLRREEDLSSNGVFLTHFLLLIYEIAAAEPGGSNMWVQHINQLLRISLMRRDVFGGERYPFIIWWLCNIDIYAMMSGAGTGEFVGSMLKNDMMPPPSFHLYPLGLDGSSIIYSEESETLPTILQLNYEVTVLAARLGLLAVELGNDELEQNLADAQRIPQLGSTNSRLRQGRVYELQEAFRQLWTAPKIALLQQNIELLPKRSNEMLQGASSLYQACLLYSHTSMWPTQRLDTGPDFEDEIAQCVSEILHIATSIISTGRLDLRFIVFPLFMAGVASSSGAEKMQALDMISSMEKEVIGSNTTSTRHVLQVVYERQTQRFMNVGHSLDVCWKLIMIEQGMQVVNFGL